MARRRGRRGRPRHRPGVAGTIPPKLSRPPRPSSRLNRAASGPQFGHGAHIAATPTGGWISADAPSTDPWLAQSSLQWHRGYTRGDDWHSPGRQPAVDPCVAPLKLDPTNLEARRLLIVGTVMTGQTDSGPRPMPDLSRLRSARRRAPPPLDRVPPCSAPRAGKMFDS